MDIIPNALPTADEQFSTTFPSSQTYSHMTASGNSRVHNGNAYYVTYNCYAGHGLPLPIHGDKCQQPPIEEPARPPHKRKRSVEDVENNMGDGRHRVTLAAALENLGQYSKSMPQQREGREGSEIAAQLTVILERLGQTRSDSDISQSLNDQVQRLLDQLRQTKRVKINAPPPRSQLSRLHKANHKVTHVKFGQWQISLVTKELTSRMVNGQVDTEIYSALHVQHAFNSRGPPIAAYFGERHNVDYTTSLHPIVSSYNQVENASKVFDLVTCDDLDGLMRLLAVGEASIRDCDERGRSLLFYACSHASVNICKFLVDSGADVDRFDRHIWNDTWKLPLTAFKNDRETEKDELDRSFLCRKYLLQSGADPTIYATNYSSDPDNEDSALFRSIGDASVRGSIELLALILREGSAFIDLCRLQDNDTSIWRYACQIASWIPTPKALQVLIEAGVDVAEVDEDGHNCLFNCVLMAQDPYKSGEFEALRFLLTIFHDVFARDLDGYSIFDGVMVQNCNITHPRGSYQQDLWYCAIYRSGLSSRTDIPPPPSRPIFGKEYRLEDYRALLYLDTWNFGWEHGRSLDYAIVHLYPLSQQQREEAPAFRQWNAADLRMMEERVLPFATGQIRELGPADEYSSESADGWETVSASEEEAGD